MNPTMVIRVRDLETSLTFYRDQMGYAVDDGPAGTAVVPLPGEKALLLSVDPIPALEPPVQELEPGSPIYLYDSGLNALHSRLTSLGVTGMVLNENPAIATLSIPDPDGYRLDFLEELPLSDAAILALYEAAPRHLQEAVAGLSEAELDLARAPGKWSIRQIVHHLADTLFASSNGVKFALAEPGRPYTPNLVYGDAFASGLDYANRPIQAELALHAAIHAHIAGLCRHLPDALDRKVMMYDQPRIVRVTLHQTVGHLFHHLDQIAETRRIHNR